VARPGLGGDITPAPEGDFSSLLKEGFALHQHAEYAKALPLLRRAVAVRPHDFFANLLVGMDLLRTGQGGGVGRLPAGGGAPGAEGGYSLAYLGEARPKRAFRGRSGGVCERGGGGARLVAGGGKCDWILRWTVRVLSAQLRSTSQGLAADHRLQAMRPMTPDVRVCWRRQYRWTPGLRVYGARLRFAVIERVGPRPGDRCERGGGS